MVHIPINNWFEVGLNLKLSERELREIERKHSPDEGRMKIEMVTKWFQSHPEVFYETLVEALMVADHENKLVAEEICSEQGMC